MNMRILWLSHLIPYPPKGGVLQRSYHLVNELAKYHEIDVLAFNQKDLIGPLFPNLPQAIAEADAAIGAICGRHSFLPIPCDEQRWGKYKLAIKSLFTAPYNISWLKSAEYACTLSQWLAEKKYDVVHFDTVSLIPFFNQIPRGIAKVLDHHNIESHMLLRRADNEKNLLKKVYFLQEGYRLQHYEKRFCPQFELNITCSDIDTDRLRTLSPASSVLTVPNGVDLNYFKPDGSETAPNRLIFIGTMTWYPNIEAVLYIAEQLWHSLRQHHPDLEIDIIGANPPERIRNLAQTHPGFNVHGFIDDVRPYLNRATVYVCPIRDGGGTKLKILDAMAMGKCIVAHPIACEGIKVTNGTDVCFAEHNADFVNQIDAMLRNQNARQAIGVRARVLMESHYGYEAIGKQFSATLETLTGKQTGDS
jgi:polysaccharide biosynthesis protein PslH